MHKGNLCKNEKEGASWTYDAPSFSFLLFYSNSVLKPESGMVGESIVNDTAEWVERNGPL